MARRFESVSILPNSQKTRLRVFGTVNITFRFENARDLTRGFVRLGQMLEHVAEANDVEEIVLRAPVFHHAVNQIES